MKKLAVVILLCVMLVVLVVLVRRKRPVKQNKNVSLINSKVDRKLKEAEYGYNKLSQINIPILYINLDKNPDRREFMEAQFKKYSIKAERVKGVYGKDLSNKDVSNDSDEIQFINYYTKLTPGEVGCDLAHLRAIKLASDRKYKAVMILEDDCSFDLMPFWNKSIDDVIREAPKDWEILQMYSFKCLFKKEGPYMKHTKGRDYCWSTACYIINEKGIDSIMSQSWDGKRFNIGTPDCVKKTTTHGGTADALIYDMVNTYVYTIPMVFAYNEILESTLHPSHTKYHLHCSNNVISEYTKLIQNTTPEMSKQQLNMAQTLSDMDDELTKRKIEFFLTSGTLLGYYREGNFIESTGDIDLGCFRAGLNADSFPEKMGPFLRKYIIGDLQHGLELTYVHTQTKIPVDIHVFYEDSDYVWFITNQGLCDDSSHHKLCRWKSAKFKLKDVMFINRVFKIPEATEQFLEERYGVNWNIPVKYNYFDGLNKGHYRGLITSDFKNKPFEITNETKITEWYPKKLRSLSQPIVWMFDKEYNYYPSSDYVSIYVNDDVVKYICRGVISKFKDIEPEEAKNEYIKICLVCEYGGICGRDPFVFLPLLSRYNFILEGDSRGFAGKPYNKICMYMKHVYEEILKKNNYISPEKSENISSKLVEYLKTVDKLYPGEYLVL